jgi:hypothetical protein
LQQSSRVPAGEMNAAAVLGAGVQPAAQPQVTAQRAGRGGVQRQ